MQPYQMFTSLKLCQKVVFVCHFSAHGCLKEVIPCVLTSVSSPCPHCHDTHHSGPLAAQSLTCFRAWKPFPGYPGCHRLRSYLFGSFLVEASAHCMSWRPCPHLLFSLHLTPTSPSLGLCAGSATSSPIRISTLRRQRLYRFCVFSEPGFTGFC